MSVDESNILNLTQLGNTEDEVIAEPGTPDNPWIGFDRIVNGQKKFYALSGAERRRLRRQHERDAVNEQERGQRAYNRQQRKIDFDTDTVRQQLRILKGELQVSPDMNRNLTNHVIRQNRLAERAAGEEQRTRVAAMRRGAQVEVRRIERFRAGQPRGKDLRSETFATYRHLLPEGHPLTARPEKAAF